MFRVALLAMILVLQGPGARTSGVIRGHIENADGTPCARVRVVAIQEEPGGNDYLLSSIAETDDSGNYQLDGIPPGRYFVLAGRLESPTFYPGVPDQRRAEVVTVTAGTVAGAVDFRVAQISVGFKVSGRIIGLDTAAGAQFPATVSLSRSNVMGSRTAPVGGDGSFEFTRIVPGVYTVTLTSANPGVVSSPATVNVVDRNPAGVEIRVRHRKELVGRVVIEGNAAMPVITIRHGNESHSEIVPYSDSIVPRPNGTFRISVLEGPQRLAVAVDNPNGYRVKSFMYGAVDLTTSSVKIAASDDAELRIVLNAGNSVRVRGRVVGLKKLKPFEEPVHVALHSHYFASALVAPVGKDGTFEFPAVMPAVYEARLHGVNRPLAPTKLVKVGRKNVDSVEITVRDRIEIQGRVMVYGSAPVPRFKVRLASGSGVGGLFEKLRKAFREEAEGAAFSEEDAPFQQTFLDEPENTIDIHPNPDGTFKALLFEGEWNIVFPPNYNAPLRPENSIKVVRKERKEFQPHVSSGVLKPPKVHGHIEGLDGVSFAPGTATVSLTSSRYAEMWKAAVQNDGTFEFPGVFPGLYALRLNAPGVAADICAPVNVARDDINDAVLSLPLRVAAPDTLQIASATFGAPRGSADVTPMVRKMVRPELHELYAASSWLEADPAVGTNKQLTVSYLYKCADHTFTTREAGAVSYAMLVEHADPSRRPRLTGRGDFSILSAHYGIGRDFTNVTARIRELIGPDAPPFIVGDAAINGGVNATRRHLTITYIYDGRRATFTTGTGGEIRYERLVENAEHPNDDRIGNVPDWLTAAER